MQGNPTPTPQSIGAQPYDADLAALAALATTGLIDRTGASTVTTRSTGETGLSLLATATQAAARSAIGAQEVFTFGTWTPSYILTGSGSVTTNAAAGEWILIPPNYVWCSLILRSASVTSPLGNVRLSLPFTASNKNEPIYIGDAASWLNATAIRGVVAANAAEIILYKNVPTAASTTVVAADLNTATSTNLIRAACIYQRAI